jgi:hypothetical protein
MGNVVVLAHYRGMVNNEIGPRRPPRPPGNAKARDFELIAMVSAIPYAARRHLWEWDRNYIRILSTAEWYRGRWAKLTPKQRQACWRIIGQISQDGGRGTA